MNVAIADLEIRDLDFDPACPFAIAFAVLGTRPDGTLRTVSGRGTSAAQARFHCRMEAVERRSALHDGHAEPVRMACADMQEPFCDPAQLVLLSRQQYRDRANWNERVSPDHRWPAPLAPDRPIDWLRARRLVDGAAAFVPAAHGLLGFPDPGAQGFPVPDSNGLAAGEYAEDAARRGLMELVERDAVAIWWYNRLSMPAPGLDGAKLPVLDAFGDWLASHGRRFWLLDLTSDIDLPVTAAIACNERGSDLSFGFGSGPSAGTAALAAMGELAQFEATKALRRSGGGAAPDDFVTWSTDMRIDDMPWLLPAAEALPGKPRIALAQIAAEAFVLDLRRGEHAVVRVVVPGLRPLWPRFAPGRLYDVPVHLGFRLAPAAESDLNPIPILY